MNCPYCHKKIRWYHQTDYYQGITYHLDCAWREINLQAARETYPPYQPPLLDVPAPPAELVIHNEMQAREADLLIKRAAMMLEAVGTTPEAFYFIDKAFTPFWQSRTPNLRNYHDIDGQAQVEWLAVFFRELVRARREARRKLGLDEMDIDGNLAVM